MLTTTEENYIKNYAYLPEHLTGYVTAISEGKPFLLGNYLLYNRKGNLIFIGYPLKKIFEEKEMREVLDTAIERFEPYQISLIAPSIPISPEVCSKRGSDSYYKLDLSDLHLDQKLRNSIKRASRELYVEKGQGLGDEHTSLISEFSGSHKVDDDTLYIFEKIPKYVSSVLTALVFNARDRQGRLVAFDIVDFGSRDYVFYMFNFMSRRYRIPGVSDLLLYEVIKTAQEQGKSFINLGLGINEGVTFFKKKWRGVPFLNYKFCFYERSYKTDKLKILLEKLQL